MMVRGIELRRTEKALQSVPEIPEAGKTGTRNAA